MGPRADAVKLGSDEYAENENKLDWKTAKPDSSEERRRDSKDDDTSQDSEAPDSQSVGFSEEEEEDYPESSKDPESPEDSGKYGHGQVRNFGRNITSNLRAWGTLSLFSTI